MQTWLLLIVSVPPEPSSLRVRIWRKLQALGAVALKNSVYLLPFTPENYEQFQWLAQEVPKSGGEATLLKVDRIENMRVDDVIRLFHKARDRGYRPLAERYRKLLPSLDRKATGATASRRDGEAARPPRGPPAPGRAHPKALADPGPEAARHDRVAARRGAAPPRPGARAAERDRL